MANVVDWSAIALKYNLAQHYVELYLSARSMDTFRIVSPH